MRKNKSSKAKNFLLEREAMKELSLVGEKEDMKNDNVKPDEKNTVHNQSFAIGPDGDENTILIKRTLRSGQSINFDGNVVILGDINPGAEIIAGGNVIVMGSLRGVVHAGAKGDETATVAAFKLQPTQLRIANHITRAPDGDYGTPDQPEIARIKDGIVMIETYQIGQDKQMKIC